MNIDKRKAHFLKFLETHQARAGSTNTYFRNKDVLRLYEIYKSKCNSINDLFQLVYGIGRPIFNKDIKRISLGNGISDLIFHDNSLLSLIKKDTKFTGATFPIPLDEGNQNEK